MAGTWYSNAWNATDVDAYWKDLVSAPEVPHEGVRQTVGELEKQVAREDAEPDPAWWASYYCQYRDIFDGTGISFGDQDSHVCKFLYAKQQPAAAAFLNADRIPSSLPCFPAVPPGQDPPYDPWLRQSD